MKDNIDRYIDTDYWVPSDHVIVIYADKFIIKYLETEIVEGRL